MLVFKIILDIKCIYISKHTYMHILICGHLYVQKTFFFSNQSRKRFVLFVNNSFGWISFLFLKYTENHAPNTLKYRLSWHAVICKDERYHCRCSWCHFSTSDIYACWLNLRRWVSSSECFFPPWDSSMILVSLTPFTFCCSRVNIKEK